MNRLLNDMLAYAGSLRHLAFALLILVGALCTGLLKKERKPLAIWLFWLLLFFYNPLSRMLCEKLLRWQDQYFLRSFWLLPLPVLGALLSVRLTEVFPGAKKGIAALACLLLIVLCGRNVYTHQGFAKGTNLFKLPQESVMVSNAMLESGEEVLALLPRELYCFPRQYSSRIHQLYGRNIEGYTSPVIDRGLLALHEEMEGEPPNYKRIFRQAKKRGASFVVLHADQGIRRAAKKNGYSHYRTIGDYELYHLSGKEV